MLLVVNNAKAIAVLLVFMAASNITYNTVEWIFGKEAEKAVEVAAKNAVKEAVYGSVAAKKNGEGALPTQNGKLEVSKATGKDYLALPLTGDYRFAMPKGVALDSLAVGPRGGYIDRFENEWVPVKGKRGVVRWLEYLSERGQLRMTGIARTKSYLVIGRDGKRI